jgi:subtilisin family serine protease
MIKSMGLIAVLLVTVLSAEAGEALRLKTSRTPIPLQDRSTELQKRHGLKKEPRHFVIQFASAITAEDQVVLKSQGIVPIRYVPDDALLVRGTQRAMGLIKVVSSRVRAVSPLAPEWKISPEFWTDPAAVPSPDSDDVIQDSTETLLVATHSDDLAIEAAREIDRIPGARVEWAQGRDLTVLARKSQLEAIASVDAVEWIERAPVMIDMTLPMSPSDADRTAPTEITGYESGTRLMGFEAAWARGYRGKGQIAAVGDSGLDSGKVETLHADFTDTFLKGYLTGLGTETWGDSMGHGTHVCGSVMGTGALSSGSFKGGAYEGKLIINGLWSAILDNLAPSTNMATLLDPSYKDGARVHSNSWGSPRNLGEYDTFAARVDEYMWNHPEMLVLFAAGNSGEDKNRDGRIDEGSVGSPATAKNVLTVGASENLLATGGIQKPLKELRDGDVKWGVEPIASSKLSDNPQGIAAFSSRGPTSDGRIKPEVVAPGTNIVSTRSHNPKSSPLWGAYNDHYAYAGGTSMATPLTAGAATVTREFLERARGFSHPSAALVKAVLMHTATDLFPGQFGTGAEQELPVRRPNVHEGYGRVDMDAITSLDADTQLVDDETGLGLASAADLTVNVGSGGVLRATLVYTDAPASAAASRTLVNDLDLSVTAPDGKVVQKQDRINNSEMLELSGLAPGAYRVSVTGINIPQGKNGKQPYALVVTAR